MEPRIDWITVENKPLMVIREGSLRQKPYFHSSKGVHVGEFDSYRQINCSELDSIIPSIPFLLPLPYTITNNLKKISEAARVKRLLSDNLDLVILSL